MTGLANESTGSQGVVTGRSYFVSESSVSAGWSAGSAVCRRNGTEFSYSSTTGFAVAANDVVVCTFTNTVNTATIQVVKRVDGAQTAGWTVNASGPSAPMVVSPSSVVTSASATANFGLRLVSGAGSSVHLAEVAQTGYTAGGVSCVRDGSTTQTGTAG